MNRLVAILVVWLVAACAAIQAGLLQRVPPPVVLLSLSVVATLASLVVPGVRDRVQELDSRLLLLPHLLRFVGAVFLVLVRRGVLAPEFVSIGWGDLVAACGAVALIAAGAPLSRGDARWWAWLFWSIFGLADMAVLGVTAVRVLATAPEKLALFRALPFGLLPTFVVPLVISTHIVILSRLVRHRVRAVA